MCGRPSWPKSIQCAEGLVGQGLTRCAEGLVGQGLTRT
ncbi:unnamed protein product [Onchocerca flexuosa]|uniref:Uncharacterized protein n=1 Tax=Onchocerca flexuosa TaxID=387005 RepID=A0A183HF77_9BILA|nr:unnamed protein product [Onchocerca flexuosa]